MKLVPYIFILALSIGIPVYAEAPATDPATPATQPTAAPAVAPTGAPTDPAQAQPGSPPAAAVAAPADAAAAATPTAGGAAPATSETPATPPADAAAPATAATEGAAANSGDSANPDAESDDREPAEGNGITTAERNQRKTGIARLIKKLSDKDGNPIPIAILTPLDYTTLNYADLAVENIVSTINRYGKFDLRTIKYAPGSLTLEEFRRIIIKFKVSVVIVCVLKPTNFDMFLFDKRTPYNIYAHSEVLPEGVQYQLTKPVVEEFTKAIVRRTLYAYMQDQYYELPREEVHSLLSTEVPRWIASDQNLHVINRELLSNWYTSVSVGAALMSGGGKSWESNIMEVELGRRIAGQIYVEGALDFFAYDAKLLSLKYLVDDRDSPYHIAAGIGLASLSNVHTLNWDETYSQGKGGSYVALSGSFSFPIVEVHFKLESRVFVGPGLIFSVMPGLFILF